MQQLQQQLAMNAAQSWQQPKKKPTHKYQNNNKNSNRGRKSRGNSNNNRNGGGNQPTWSTNIPRKFNRKNIPKNVRSNETPEYCWTHGHDTRHNSNECTAQCAGHRNNATTHVNTGSNPKNVEHVLASSAVGITGIYVRARGQIQQQPSWNQQANMGYCMPTQKPMMIQHPTMQPMIHQPIMQQQQQQ